MNNVIRYWYCIGTKKILFNLIKSVADPDPGSSAFLTPGPGSGIPNPYLLELSDKFLRSITYSLKTGPNFFLQHFKKENYFQFCEICDYKKRYDNIFFSPLSFVEVLDPGSEIRDPGWVKSLDLIKIPDPQH